MHSVLIRNFQSQAYNDTIRVDEFFARIAKKTMSDNPLQFSASRKKRKEFMTKVKARIDQIKDQGVTYKVKWTGIASEMIVENGVRLWVAVNPESQTLLVKVDESSTRRKPSERPQDPNNYHDCDKAVDSVIGSLKSKLYESRDNH